MARVVVCFWRLRHTRGIKTISTPTNSAAFVTKMSVYRPLYPMVTDCCFPFVFCFIQGIIHFILKTWSSKIVFHIMEALCLWAELVWSVLLNQKLCPKISIRLSGHRANTQFIIYCSFIANLLKTIDKKTHGIETMSFTSLPLQWLNKAGPLSILFFACVSEGIDVDKGAHLLWHF